MPSVVMLNVIMQNVVAPTQTPFERKDTKLMFVPWTINPTIELEKVVWQCQLYSEVKISSSYQGIDN
jgi:hypothetical protein